jgi:hypothetical protein
MRHYSKAEWLWFINNESHASLHQDMQEHMLTCDDCMVIYSDLIDGIDIEESVISKDFTDRVIEMVHKDKIESTQAKLKQKRINAMVNYISAASITLFLMGAGAFQDIYRNFSSEGKHISEASQKQSLFVSGWTNTLTTVTSNLINGIKNQ